MSDRAKLLLILVLLAVFRLAMASQTELLPEEAYYWTYSQNLSLSYFDHPNMVANIIYVFGLFGNGELFVRMGAVLLSVLTALMAYKLTAFLFDEKKAVLTALLVSVLPVYASSSFLMTPDAPLYFFWILTMYFFARATLGNESGGTGNPALKWWCLAGASLGAAFSSKYTSSFLALSAFVFLLLSGRNRKWFLRKEPYLALAIAFVVFLPVIIWNYQHDWASFKFQSVERARNSVPFSVKLFLWYLGVQFALVFPLLPIAVYAWYGSIKRHIIKEKDERVLFLLSFALPMILFFGASSFNQKVKLNWTGPAYFAAIILAVALLGNRLKSFFKYTVVFCVTLVVLAHIYLCFPFPGIPAANLFTGWEEVAENIKGRIAHLPSGSRVFIVGAGSKYQMVSEMNYYLGGSVPVISVNAFGQRALHYDYLRQPEQFLGYDGFVVYDTVQPPANLWEKLGVFESAGEPEKLRIVRNGRFVREFAVIYCRNYLGPGRRLPAEKN